jgi:hypothetical protein
MTMTYNDEEDHLVSGIPTEGMDILRFFPITLLHKVSVHHISGVYAKNQYDQTTDLSPILEDLLKE